MRTVLLSAVKALMAATVAFGPTLGPVPSPGQWALDSRHLDAPQLWSLSTGREMVVAVVDSGVDDHHPDLAGRVLPGADLTGTSTDGRSDVSSTGHGTAVAAIIAGRGAGPDGVTGLAPDAQILPVRVSTDLVSDPAVLAQGIDWAVNHHAQIVNVSICLAIDDPQVRAAVREAIDKDVIVIAAAGNDGQTTNHPQYPASLPGVLAVAASDPAGSLGRTANPAPTSD